jgi:hypothetical protein
MLPFKIEDMGRVLASRKLYLVDPPQITFEVNIYQPKAFSEGGGFYCPIQVNGSSENKVFYGAGLDSMQALDLSLKSLASLIDVLSRDLGGKLRWTDEDDKLGFTLIDGTKI